MCCEFVNRCTTLHWKMFTSLYKFDQSNFISVRMNITMFVKDSGWSFCEKIWCLYKVYVQYTFKLVLLSSIFVISLFTKLHKIRTNCRVEDKVVKLLTPSIILIRLDFSLYSSLGYGCSAALYSEWEKVKYGQG